MDGFSNLMQLGNLTPRGGPSMPPGFPPSHGGPVMPPNVGQSFATAPQRFGGGFPPAFGGPSMPYGGFPMAHGGPQLPFGGLPMGMGSPSMPYGMQNLNLLQNLYSGGGY